MRRILQSQGAEVIHLGHDRSVRRGGRTRSSRRTPRASRSAPTRAATSSTSSYLVDQLRRARAPGTSGSSAAAAGSSSRRRSSRLRRGRACAIFSPEDGQRLGLPGMINELIRDCDIDLAAERRRAPTRCWTGDRQRARPRHHRACRAGRLPDARPDGADARPPGPPGPGARHHRHRRLRQVVADRRAGPPVPHRPAGQAAGRGAGRRPDPAARRRRAARRPDPDERARTARHGLLPLAGHPGRRASCRTDMRRRHRRLPGGRLRPGDPRDAGHRPGRRRRSCRSPTCRCT